MKLRSNSSTICIHRHSEMSEKDLLKRVSKLSPSDSRKFEKLLHPSRKMQFLSARAALIEMDISLEELTNMPEGKPIHPDAFISMGHTASHGAAISSAEHPCGIDIETIGRDVARTRKRFVRPDENLLFCVQRPACMGGQGSCIETHRSAHTRLPERHADRRAR